MNLQKISEKHEPFEKSVSQTITKNTLRERFIARTFNQYKTVKKAFVEWKLTGGNYIERDRFNQLVGGWGFNAEPRQVQALYEWLDKDGDGKISYEDLR